MHWAAGLRTRCRGLPEPGLVTADDGPWGVHVARGSEVAAAQALEHDIFVAEGFCERSERAVVDAYSHLDPQSRWYVAHAADGTEVGVVRVMEAQPEQVPALVHFDISEGVRSLLEHERLQEIGTLAVVPSHREKDVALHLCRAVVCAAAEAGITAWVVVVEVWLLEYMQGLGFPFEQISPTRHYMGGECPAARLLFKEVPLALRSRDEAFYLWMTRGLFEAGVT